MPGTIRWTIQLSKIKLSPLPIHFLLSQQREIQDVHCRFRLSKKTCPKPVKLSFHICSYCRNQRPKFSCLNFLVRQMIPLGWCLWWISELELQIEKYAFVKLLETRSYRRLICGVWKKDLKHGVYSWGLYTKYPNVMPIVKQKGGQKRDWDSEEMVVYVEFHPPGKMAGTLFVTWIPFQIVISDWSSRSKSWLESVLNLTFTLCVK